MRFVLLGIAFVLCLVWFGLLSLWGLLTLTGLADEPTYIYTRPRSLKVFALASPGLMGMLAIGWLVRRLDPRRARRPGGFPVTPPPDPRDR
jgi:hypothetical protein